MPVKGGYLLAAGGGIILLWSGLKGKGVGASLRSIISGKNPALTTTAYPIQTAPSAYAYGAGLGTAGGVSAAVGHTNSQIANDALSYQGAGYVWAGAPGAGAGNWDCSSFVNAVVGRDLGMAIPGYGPGAYHGQSHGPNTVIWLVWSGATRIQRSLAQAGDLAIWQTHMGIVIDNGIHMISALDQQLGTKVTTINGGAPPGEILTVKRLK